MSNIRQDIDFTQDNGLNEDSDVRLIPSGDGTNRRNILIGEEGSGGAITNMKGTDALFRGFDFRMCLVRNKEMDNRLATSATSQLAITVKSGVVLTVPNIPDYYAFDESGWIAMLCDADKTSTTDPNVSGDYLYRLPCTIDKDAKTLTFAVGSTLTAWEVGDNLVLYNPFLNYTFTGDQSSAALISYTGAPAWRSGNQAGGCVFKKVDGTYVWVILGYSAANVFSIGYATSTDGDTWTMGNSDAPVYVPNSAIEACDGGWLGGSCYKMTNGTYYTLLSYTRTSDTNAVSRILYFNEDFSTITYSNYITVGGVATGWRGESVIQIGDEYHLVFMYPYPATKPTRALCFGKCSTVDGNYIQYQTSVQGSTSNNGTAYSYDVNQPTLITDGHEYYCLFGAEANYAPSGTKANREYCLSVYNPGTNLWDEDRRGAVLMSPTYFGSMGLNYVWASDHGGGYPSIYIDSDINKVFVSWTLRGTVYNVALATINSLGGYVTVGSYYNPDTRYAYWIEHNIDSKANRVVRYHSETETIDIIFEDHENVFGIDEHYKMKDIRMVDNYLFFNPRISEPKMIDVEMAYNYTHYLTWLATTVYTAGQSCKFYGGIFTANTTTAAAESPATHPAKWDRIGNCYYDSLTTAFNVIKTPPILTLSYLYGTDTTRNFNSLRRRMFRFACAYKYWDNTTSVYSSHSPVTLPIDDEQYDGEILEDVMVNNKLTLTIYSGDPSLVHEIDLVFQEDGGDWKRITTISRINPTNITSDTISVDFYNDKAYEAVDNALLDIVYDAVPKTAAAQEIISENILCYLRVKEGFDNIDKDDLDVTLTPEEVEIVIPTTPASTIRDMVISGDISRDSIIDGKTILDFGWFAGVAAGQYFTITMGGIQNTYILTTADDDSAVALATGIGGFLDTVYGGYHIEVVSDTVEISKPVHLPPEVTECIIYVSGAVVSELTKKGGFKTGAIHPFCLYYYDESMRRGDAQVSDGMSIYVPTMNEISVSTTNYREKINWQVDHTPPSWAHYWRWGYAGNTLCSYFVQYICSAIHEPDVAFGGKTTITIEPLQIIGTTTAGSWGTTNVFVNTNIDPYVWAKGDRCRVLTELTDAGAGDTLGAPLGSVYDYEILEYNAASFKIVIQATTITTHNAGLNSLIEIYRPLAVGERTVYYEFGDLYEVSGGYHKGATQDQTAALPALGVFDWGDVYHILRTPTKPLDSTAIHTGAFHEAAWYSDFYPSESWSYGKVGFESTIGEVTLNNIRYSNVYLQNTKINGLSTFETDHYKELNDIYGNAVSMVESGDTLKVYQTTKPASIFIGRQEYMDSQGNYTMTTSDRVLGSVNYSATRYGTVYPESITINNRFIYGFDIYNGVMFRDSPNGIFPISGRYEAVDGAGDYKMESYFKTKAKALLLSGIENTAVFSVWDEEYKLLYVFFADSVTPANNDVIAFHEPSNRWISKYDFLVPTGLTTTEPPDWAQSLSLGFLSFGLSQTGDSVWRHNSNTANNRCTFYGVKQDCVVDLVANQGGSEIKLFDSLALHTNKLWRATVEIDPTLNYYRGMSSVIPSTRFKKREGVLMSEFMRNGKTHQDTATVLDYVGGEQLRGYAATIELTNTDTDKAELLMVTVNMTKSDV